MKNKSQSAINADAAKAGAPSPSTITTTRANAKNAFAVNRFISSFPFINETKQS